MALSGTECQRVSGLYRIWHSGQGSARRRCKSLTLRSRCAAQVRVAAVPMLGTMNEDRGMRSGHLMALGGAVLTLASRWAPWYRLHLPAAVRDVLQQRAYAYGPAAGNFMRSLASLLPDSVSGDAWLVFGRTDVVLALISALVIVTLLAAAGTFGPGIGVAGSSAARVASVAGTVAGLAVVARMIDAPGAPRRPSLRGCSRV